jgi:aminoethylphosphonate catabolism LysR family transcriptional regulator
MNPSSSAELRAFDATARTGSMSAAARLLGIRQPTVSAHIANLEQNFTVELFHRRGRKILLTAFGRLLHEVTDRIYRSEGRAVELLLAARNRYHGVLRVGAVGPYNVTPMIKGYRASHPNVQIMVSMGDSREVVARVVNLQDDVGVLLHAVNDPRMLCLPYRRQPLAVFAPAGHELAQRATVRMRDLHGMEFVLREDGSETRRIFESGLAAAGVTVSGSVEMGSREAVREAVAQGLGLGVVARAAFAPDPRIKLLKIDDLNVFTHVHVICLRERCDAALISGFLEIVRTLVAVPTA